MKKLLLTIALCLAVSGGTVGTAISGTVSGASYTYIMNGLWCIHRYEGAWNDPYAPYYGGLQMDIPFMQHYGYSYYRRWGTADHWPVWAQMQAGVNGYLVQGWYAWPNTARLCGLI